MDAAPSPPPMAQAGTSQLANRDGGRDLASHIPSPGAGADAAMPAASAARPSPPAAEGPERFAAAAPAQPRPGAAALLADTSNAEAPPAAAAPGERTRTPAYGERTIAEAELLCFANPRPERPYEISIELPEFTCKCPFSGYPDFAVLRLIYQPGPRVVELKAIKLYVNSYRDRSISHEEVANRILDDLVEACEPVWMQLSADFNPRGNVHTVVRVSHGSRQPC